MSLEFHIIVFHKATVFDSLKYGHTSIPTTNVCVNETAYTRNH